MKTALLATAFLTLLSLVAEARSYHHRYYGHYLAYNHYRQTHRHHYSHHFGRHLASYWRKRYHRHLTRRYYRHHDPVAHHYGLTKEKLPDGQTIVVASQFANRFVGFFREVFDREWKLPEIGCYAPRGHMRHSLHHWGGACDVGQTRRNVAWGPMLRSRITEIAHRWGLTNGCEWRYSPDCGHVEVNRRMAVVPAIALQAVAAVRRPRTYQVAGGWPL